MRTHPGEEEEAHAVHRIARSDRSQQDAVVEEQRDRARQGEGAEAEDEEGHLDVVGVELRAEDGGLGDGRDSLAVPLDVLDARARALGQELARDEILGGARADDGGGGAEQSPEQEGAGRQGDRRRLAPEGGGHLAAQQAAHPDRKARQLPRDPAAALPVDEAVAAPDQVVEAPEQVGVGGERTGAVEVGGDQAVEAEQLPHAGRPELALGSAVGHVEQLRQAPPAVLTLPGPAFDVDHGVYLPLSPASRATAAA